MYMILSLYWLTAAKTIICPIINLFENRILLFYSSKQPVAGIELRRRATHLVSYIRVKYIYMYCTYICIPNSITRLTDVLIFFFIIYITWNKIKFVLVLSHFDKREKQRTSAQAVRFASHPCLWSIMPYRITAFSPLYTHLKTLYRHSRRTCIRRNCRNRLSE